MLSMLQQMLHFDKSDEVREAATRSLAIIVSFIDDQSKYNQVRKKERKKSYIRSSLLMFRPVQ